MNSVVKSIWVKLRTFAENYPAIVAAVVIYCYYLFSSVELFKHRQKESLLDYFFQYDSLFFMWIAAAALLQVVKVRKSQKVEQERRYEIERALDRQQIHEKLLNDITMLLQDNVNNPLAVISVTTREIRRKFENDAEILKWLDRIESSIQRIHNTIRDLQSYESNKILHETSSALKDNLNGK
jgi:signal transduction histidine kinase